jgi:Rps23 Pro-64 3,4-dihydroxylase Tpa1-like proline 4-hydroxylase
MELINPTVFEATKAASLRKAFDSALPYRHLVIDQFLQPVVAESLYQHFPSVDALKTHWKSINEKKSEGSDFSSFHPVFSQLRDLFMSKTFCEWISQVTGIEEVFITNDQMGAGIHQGSDGSFLDIHIDFNIHHLLNVHRRLNMLIYLEKNWQETFGGQLEMWNADMTRCEKMVVPAFNRCVIFETNEISYHGYGKITVPPDITRKSFFTYFYTHTREGASGYHDTIFKPRPDDTTAKKIQTTIKENIKNTAKATLKKLGVKF